MHLGINARFLRQAGDDGKPTVPFLNRRIAIVLSSTATDGMVEVGPVAADLGDLLSSISQSKEVDHVRRLVDKHAPALVSQRPRQGSDW